MPGPEVGGGKVAITIDGRPAFLEPSLEACIEISKMAGGLNGAMERCRALHFDTLCMIVGAGLVIDGNRLNPRQRQDMLPKAIYEAGTIDIAAACMEFVTIVGNGGRALSDEGPEEEDPDGPLGSAT